VKSQRKNETTRTDPHVPHKIRELKMVRQIRKIQVQRRLLKIKKRGFPLYIQVIGDGRSDTPAESVNSLPLLFSKIHYFFSFHTTRENIHSSDFSIPRIIRWCSGLVGKRDVPLKFRKSHFGTRFTFCD
jgi:hypothetical protein